MTEHDLGNGARLELHDLSGFKDLPSVKAAVRAKAEQAAELANSIAVTEPDDDGEPLYYVRTRDGVVGVMPDSFKGVVDDSYHSTLLKVRAQEGIND
jgi:hypothetical protein